ncbi:hypothetical protein II810_02690, partial [bacterium]|nr:hypothetical protein [bacterium]
MIRTKSAKRKAIASALTFCFFLQQSFCLQVLATNISGAQYDSTTGTYNVGPAARNGDIGFRKYANFDLSDGDILNMIFQNKTDGVDINTFVNMVDSQINIQGILNAVNAAGALKENGHVVLVSP